MRIQRDTFEDKWQKDNDKNEYGSRDNERVGFIRTALNLRPGLVAFHGNHLPVMLASQWALFLVPDAPF